MRGPEVAAAEIERGIPSELSLEDKRNLVQKILSSMLFSRTARQRDFLSYICACTLKTPPEEVHELQIGFHVFGRQPDYNASDDNIVRVAARQLRIRLKEYFDTEGKNEEWLIEVPKGGYSPVFIRRLEAPSQNAIQPLEFVKATLIPNPNASRRLWMAALACAAALCLAFGFEIVRLNRKIVSLSPPANPINQIFFQTENRLNVITSDSTVVQIGLLSEEVVGLDDYVNRKYPKLRHLLDWPGKDSFAKRLATRQSASLADVSIAAKIVASAGEHRDKVRFLHPRNIQTRIFHSDDSLILGGVRSNPWVSLYEQQLNFQFGSGDINRQVEIINRNPQPGERSIYIPDGDDDSAGRSYARVALVKNLTNTGKLLLLGGTSMAATEEAGNYMLNPASLAKLKVLLNTNSPSQLEYFELLFEVVVLDGASKGAQVIAHREGSKTQTY